jgi:hypothetical protein
MSLDGLGDDLPRPASIDVIFEDLIVTSSFPGPTVCLARLPITQERVPYVCFLWPRMRSPNGGPPQMPRRVKCSSSERQHRALHLYRQAAPNRNVSQQLRR